MLKINDLCVNYGDVATLKNINLHIKKGEIIGLVGESGSGKSTIIKSIIGLLGKTAVITKGAIEYKGQDLVRMSNEEMRRLRGNNISLIYQQPQRYLDPVITIENQFYETMNMHRNVSKEEAIEHAEELFRKLDLDDVQKILKSYPFELSGGMCQRVAIAIAMANEPDLLLADEPTSALDVTVQTQAIETMMNLREEFNTTIFMVTHNMGVVAYMADKVGVMYNGELVEWGTKEEILFNPQHKYTKSLIDSIPMIKEY